MNLGDVGENGEAGGNGRGGWNYFGVRQVGHG